MNNSMFVLAQDLSPTAIGVIGSTQGASHVAMISKPNEVAAAILAAAERAK